MPYNIWLSEIILQQTRIAQGLPYYQKFVETYSNVHALASASEDHVLKLWQGLGYYSRARNMLHCAKTVVEKHDGIFPSSYEELKKLKGIGSYTAAAIASISFDGKVPAIDGNAFRVLSRLYGLHEDISKPKTFKLFFDLALKIMPDQECGDFNQAIMELGALICLPKKPKCNICPVREYCYASEHNLQSSFPVKTKKIKIKHRYFDYFVVQHKGKLLIKSRAQGDIWTGLYEFILIENKKTTKTKEQELFGVSSRMDTNNHVFSSAELSHSLTHQKLHILFHIWQVSSATFLALKKKYTMKSIDISEIHNFAVPKPIELFLKNEYLLLN